MQFKPTKKDRKSKKPNDWFNGGITMNPKEHEEHREFYDDDCNLCQLEQRLNQVLEMDEFKQFNPFTEDLK